MKEFIKIKESEVVEIKGRWGLYSELNPIEIVEKDFILPIECLNDKDLAYAKPKLEELKDKNKTVEIIDWKDAGNLIVKNQLYLYKFNEGSENSDVVKANEDFTKLNITPETNPELFKIKKIIEE